MQKDQNNQKFINSIYHEQQIGALCAVHAVNAILQEKYWNEFMFAEIARSLDNQEEKLMLEKGITKEYKSFKNKSSTNYDDSGFFSISVIIKALEINGFNLVHINKPEEKNIRKNPVLGTSFLCNLRNHWFTIRKFGTKNFGYWFDLNSTNKFPRYVSDTYLSLFLEQLIKENYTIFVVNGKFPVSKADSIFNTFNPKTYVVPRVEKKEIDFSKIQNDQERNDLQRAIEMSKQHMDYGNQNTVDEFQKVLELSRLEYQKKNGTNNNFGQNKGMTDLERAIALSLKNTSPKVENEKKQVKEDQDEDNDDDIDMDTDPDLKRALEMSLEQQKTDMMQIEDNTKKRNIEELKKKFEIEPNPKGEEKIVLIRFKNPKGFVDKKFLDNDSVETLIEFMEVLGYSNNEHILVLSGIKKLEIKEDIFQKTLKELNITGRVQMMILAK